MKRSDTLALAGLIIVSLGGVAFTKSFAYHLYFGEMPAGTMSIAIAGWAIAAYGPILLAWLFWRMAQRISVAWLLHMMLLPSFYALLLAGNALMLSTLEVPDFDDTLGAPIMPALLSIAVTAIVYFSALVARHVRGGVAHGR